MNDQRHRQIARMKWDDLERNLLPAGRGLRAEALGEPLRDYFGDEEYEKLRQLAVQSRAVRERRERAKQEPLGNIVLLPGIMGSNLTRAGAGDTDLLWIHYLRIINGALSELQLGRNGKDPARPGLKIEPTDVDKRTYARAVLKLRARWNVEPFPYDWRKDLDEASDRLGRFIKEKFGGKPVSLVGHSMGGLVARNFIRRHPGQWEAMRGDERQGGRLIMLGTPNYGSFNIVQVLTGVESLVILLSRVDLRNNLNEIVKIIGTFLGCYLLLPAPEKLPALAQALYDRATWGAYPVSELHLERARRFYEGLKDPATIDPARMTYIAGCNRQTISGLEVMAPGEFRYRTTAAGDGRVTHELGLLDGVRTYYVDETHGDLAKNNLVLQAVEEVLQRGVSSLPERPVAPRAAAAEGRWSRSIGEYQAAAQLEQFARRVAGGDPVAPEETRAAEETLLRAATGGDPAAREVAALRRGQVQSSKKDRPKLEVEVRHQDVTKVTAPVVVAGHYKGVKPVNALGALDRKLDRWISRANEHSMIGGDLGRLFFIPIRQGQLGADAVLVAGMGEEGKFGEDDLRYLMLNVAFGISALKEKSFATLLIGAGKGNLNVDQAVRGMVHGVCDALKRLPRSDRIGKVAIIEIDHGRCLEIHDQLKKMQEDDAIGVDLALAAGGNAPRENSALKPAASAGPARKTGAKFAPRLTVERDGDVFRFSALIEQAVIPVRQVEIQSYFPDQIADRLRNSVYRAEQERLGRLLTTTLVPEDFAEVLDQPGPLTLILDRSTAEIPWEMAAHERPTGTSFLGPDLRLTRQFRTFLSPPPGIAPANNERLRVLVIADPAPEPELQLPGARREGREVVRLLNRIKTDFGLDIEVVDRIGDAECDPVDVLSLMLDGGFDVIHYAGHGEFNKEDPKRGGWIFGRDLTLTSREIFRARRVPRLVFANACYSAVVNPGRPLTPAEINRGLAGIAEAFFERGVQNYIGSGWPVADDQAVNFALTFYSWALTGGPVGEEPQPGKGRRARAAAQDRPGGKLIANPQPLAEAVGKARQEIAHDGSTWGAYHHYGRASETIISHGPAEPAPAKRPASKAKKKRTGRGGAKKGRKSSRV